jgi:TonB family protein
VAIQFELPKGDAPAAGVEPVVSAPALDPAAASEAQLQMTVLSLRNQLAHARELAADRNTPGAQAAATQLEAKLSAAEAAWSQTRERAAQILPAPTFESIRITGLPESARNELLASLPVREGDAFSIETARKLIQAVKNFDEHLDVRFPPAIGRNQYAVEIAAPRATPSLPARIKVGGNVQAAMVVRKVTPIYPELAKQSGVEGTVALAALIAKDGTVQQLRSIDGPPMLIQPALDAVKQWVYKPTLLNGNPVEVETTITVTFALNQ